MKEESRKLLHNANRALQAAETLSRAGDSESAAGRCYYAMLHAAQALLRDLDVRFRRHGAVHAAYGEHFAKTALLDPKYHRWLLDAFDERLWSDYDIDVTFNPEAIRRGSSRPASSSMPPASTLRQAHDRRPQAH